MNLAEASVAYVRHKTSSGQWWGDTIRKNRDALWNFTQHVPHAVAVDVTRVKRDHVQAWLDANPAHSPAYKRGRRSAVRGLFRWLHQNGHVRRDPTVGVTVAEIPESVPRGFNDDEVERLFDVARRDPRELVCVSLCWNEGLRRVEVARVIVEDLAEPTRTLAVRGKGYRGRVSRHVAVSPETMTAIAAYRATTGNRTGALIQSLTEPGCGIGGAAVGKVIEQVIKAAGLKRFPWDGRASHSGRHTAATQALEAGAPAEMLKRQFGWTTDAMVRRYTKGAALDLHKLHELRAQRRDELAL